MASDHGEATGVAPHGDRDAGSGRTGDCRSNARDDGHIYAGPSQCYGLLAAPSEHERVAALEANHGVDPA